MSQREENKQSYLHGYSTKEQDRLYDQARFLEQAVYRFVEYPENGHILEVGCGVGAQTEILLRRFPTLTLDCVDFSEDQLKRARERLETPMKEGRVTFSQGDAKKLTHKDQSYDGAFVCWLLEHIPEPVQVLRELHRVLKPGAKVTCSEVLNQSFFVHPYSPATLSYWFQFNDHQWNLGGDPFVGAKLGNLLLEAGFAGVETRPVIFHRDNRAPIQRAHFVEYWTDLLLSAAPGLIKAGCVSEELVEQMRGELDSLKKDPNSVIFFSAIQADGLRV